MTRWQGDKVTAFGLRITEYGSRITDHRLPLTLFFLLLLTFFHKMAFSNLILARGDTFLYFYPYWQAAAEALHDGRVPLWNPNLFMGSPFLANSQVGFFYPLNWPVWLLLRTPYAVSASILLHLGIGGVGAFLAARKALGLEGWASLVTAVLFALGGYLTAQAEHINQLQGLVWLPWYLVIIGQCAAETHPSKWVRRGGAAAAFAVLFALQLLAGHSQTAFISGVTILIWLIAEFVSTRLLRNTEYGLRFTFRWQHLQTAVPAALLMGGLLALLLTAVQLLPTLELAGQSSRQGGLPPNEVLSFSLHPLLLARALLPVYGQSLFSEYVAFLPLTAVVLAIIGAWQWRRWPGVFPALILVAVGLFLALGVFNPANWLLARLPIFDLFRVPARWLALLTLGIALLAGAGFQVALDRHYRRTRPWQDVPERARLELVHIERPLRVAIYSILGLMAWNALAGVLVIFIPTGPEAPFETVPAITILLWLVELLLAYWILTGERVGYDKNGRFKIGLKRAQPHSPFWLLVITIVSLFLASRTLPYNNLTTPEAYFDLRPPITRLQVATCDLPPATCHLPPDRFLSLSNIFFDVGDQAEIDTIYEDQLPEAARYDYTVAIKHKEVIGPNLPMAFGLAAVDGFDGGILPLRSYTELMRLILPEGEETTDGRLREHLSATPEARWLDLFNARYLITDKTGDEWQNGIFFDLQHPVVLAPGENVAVGWLPDFPATELQLITDEAVEAVLVETAAGERWELTAVPLSDNLYRAIFPQTAVPQAITITNSTTAPLSVRGLSLVNSEQETFQPLTLGQYRLIHSGDVKIYENLDVLPRAFIVHQWQWQPDVAATSEAMRDEEFNSRETAFVVGDPPLVAGTSALADGDQSSTTNEVVLARYEPEYVVLQTNSDTDGLLLLTEAFYPGWHATIDGEPTPIFQADGYFQGVFVSAGEHEIQFEFVPKSWMHGRVLSLIGLALWLILIIVLAILWRPRHQAKMP